MQDDAHPRAAFRNELLCGAVDLSARAPLRLTSFGIDLPEPFDDVNLPERQPVLHAQLSQGRVTELVTACAPTGVARAHVELSHRSSPSRQSTSLSVPAAPSSFLFDLQPA